MNNKKRIVWSFVLSLVLILTVLVASVVKTVAYNRVRHHVTLEVDTLFSAGEVEGSVSVSAAARAST